MSIFLPRGNGSRRQQGQGFAGKSTKANEPWVRPRRDGSGTKESIDLNRHGNASFSGSTRGSGSGLLRRALAVRGPSRDARGTGAPSAGSRRGMLAVPALALAALAFGAASAAAAPPAVTMGPVTGVFGDRA